MKRMVQANIKRQHHQISAKHIMFIMSAKTVSSDIMPIINQKENRLSDIYAIKVAFLVFILL